MSCSTYRLRKLARIIYDIPRTLGYGIWAFGSLPARLERRAWERLVRLAGSKGLSVKAPSAERNSGTVYGEVNGRFVILKPDDAGQSTVSALFSNEKLTVIGIQGSSGSADSMSELAPHGGHFKRMFRWCNSSGDELERLKQHPEVLDQLAEFYCDWSWYLSRVTVNEHKLECRLRQSWFIPAVPVPLAEQLLPELVTVTAALEQVLGEAGQPVQPGWYTGEGGS